MELCEIKCSLELLSLYYIYIKIITVETDALAATSVTLQLHSVQIKVWSEDH